MEVLTEDKPVAHFSDYKGGWGKYCIYNPSIQFKIFLTKIDRTTDLTRVDEAFEGKNVKSNTFAIFSIHALQNYLRVNPNLTSIDFENIIPHLYVS